ncbi:response regulator transcription factor [Kineococcus sp. R86509]|uniref:response regulator transcription factor n=1 Tax=Kineococcus sp. R86509 TaxID=3093851 RepID=UPI0036D25259
MERFCKVISASLDERDKKLISLISEGYSNRKIGQHLHLAPSTIANRISRLLKDTGASNRAQLAAQSQQIIKA